MGITDDKGSRFGPSTKTYSVRLPVSMPVPVSKAEKKWERGMLVFRRLSVSKGVSLNGTSILAVTTKLFFTADSNK